MAFRKTILPCPELPEGAEAPRHSTDLAAAAAARIPSSVEAAVLGPEVEAAADSSCPRVRWAVPRHRPHSGSREGKRSAASDSEAFRCPSHHFRCRGQFPVAEAVSGTLRAGAEAELGNKIIEITSYFLVKCCLNPHLVPSVP